MGDSQVGRRPTSEITTSGYAGEAMKTLHFYRHIQLGNHVLALAKRRLANCGEAFQTSSPQFA